MELLSCRDMAPIHTTRAVVPRLVWWIDSEDDTDQGGWIVELTGFGVMHPYCYVDMMGEDDELSKEIILRTNYRNARS